MKRIIVPALAFAAFLHLPLPAAAGDAFADALSIDLPAAVTSARALPPPQTPVTLRVLSYNIEGVFPWRHIVKRGPLVVGNRFAEIGARLKSLREAGRGPQVVVLQEAFHSGVKDLVREAGYPHMKGGTGTQIGKLAGNGLHVLSEYPILSAESISFRGPCVGWDCAAAKGVLHVRLAVPGLKEPLDVYNTHLNADQTDHPTPQTLSIRIHQSRAMAEFIARTRKGAAIIGGDFNFKHGWEDYRSFMAALPLRNTAEACARLPGEAGETAAKILLSAIDHLFILNSAAAIIEPLGVARTFSEHFFGRQLSDHKGVEAVYTIWPQPAPAPF